jgi:hypothetical protein
MVKGHKRHEIIRGWQAQFGRKNLRQMYTNIYDDVKEVIAPMPYVVEETSKLTWDGRQFILRIPKEIAEEAGITTENRVSFKFVKPAPDSNEKPKLEITVL